MDSMDIDTPDQSIRDIPLRPVRPLESGVGLPYAPENWPNPGDTWRWKVGPRINSKGHFLDRYLYPPKHLPGLTTEVLRKGNAFRSKLSLDRFIRLAFPKADVNKFFDSFSWRIPSSDGIAQKQCILPVSSSNEDPMHENISDISVCKAGNDKCWSLIPPSETEPLPAMPCDICCTEPSFCSDCCCILCCKSVSLEHKGYSYIKCDAVVSEGCICGHLAHVNCALRAYMAGTIGGKIGLDAEYYCRRCDAKKDLLPHVIRFLEICQTVEYQGDVEKILNLGICILRGSQRNNAKELLNCIQSTVIKLKCGTNLEDLWNDDTRTIWSGIAQKQCLLPVYSSDEDPMHENRTDVAVCKAGNDKCGSLMPPSETKLVLPAMPCDICCTEPNFCTDCCCILCCRPVSLEHKGYSYIKCDAMVSEGCICGHLAHVNCALRAYMAGTIVGKTGLDVEYYCRRCDGKKDLVPHVNRFLEICQTVEYQGDVEKILNLGICILRGSQRDNAKELLNCIESKVIKLKCGMSLKDLWNDNTPTIWSDLSNSAKAKDNDTLQSLQAVKLMSPMPFNHETEMHKLDKEIREVLKALRKAQESEYQIAEDKLYAQKECLSNLYKQLEKEKSEISRRVSGTNADSLMINVLKKLDQIKKEVTELKEMKEVAKGFGRTSREILEEYFHLRIEK